MWQIISHMMSCFSSHTVVSAFGLNALLSLLLHLVRRRIVNVGLALGEQLFAKFHDDGEMIAGVGELVWMDLQHGNVFQDDLRRMNRCFFHHNNEEHLNPSG